MEETSDQLSQVELLAEEFLDRQQRGEKPTIREYCEKYPELADEIREVFEAVAMVEELKPDSNDATGTFGNGVQVDGKRPERVGDYRILREVGRGGMGVVYEAEQESLRRRVALKVMPKNLAGDEKALIRFQREARAAGRMHHTNIVPVFEVGEDEVHVFYAMQLIQGQGLDLVVDDLRSLRTEQLKLREENSIPGRALPADDSNRHSLAASLVTGRFHQDNLIEQVEHEQAAGNPGRSFQDEAYAETVLQDSGSTPSAVLPGQSELSTAQSDQNSYFRSVAEIGLQTSRALSYAHARGIIHRDIKPSNLILDSAGVVWVTDFGLAKTGDEGMTHTGDILGTIRYMSPERFQGQCDVRADVYSLGLTLYEMLVLKPAFASPDRLRLIEMVTKTEPELPRSLDPKIPRDLETIVLKCIDKDVRRRYQSADELSEDLQRFVDDEPIHARRISPVERFFRWSRRNKALAISQCIVATLLFVIAAGTSIWALNAQQAKAVKEHELRTSRQNRLAAQAIALQEKMPQRSLLLALAAIEDAEQNGDDIPRLAIEALQTILAQTQGKNVRSFADQTPWLFVNDGTSLRMLTSEDDGYWLYQLDGDSAVPLGRLGNLSPQASTLPSDQSLIDRYSGLPWVAFVSETGKITVINLASDSPFKPVKEWIASESEPIDQLGISPDGKRVISTAGETAKLWKLEGEVEVIEEIPLPFPNPTFTFSPDGSLLVISRKGADKVVIHDTTTRNRSLELEINRYGLCSPAFSDDGRFLAVSSFETSFAASVVVFDLRDEDPQSSRQIVGEHSLGVTSLAFTPKGTLISTGWDENAQRFFDSNHQDIVLRGHSDAVVRSAVSPSGRWLATASFDHTICLWDLESSDPHQSVRILRGHDHAVYQLAFSPDGKRLFSISSNARVRVWQVEESNPLKTRHIIRDPDCAQNFCGSFLRGYSSDNAFPSAVNGYLIGKLSNDQWRMWNVDENDLVGQVIHLDPSADVRNGTISEDGRWLYRPSDSTLVRLGKEGDESRFWTLNSQKHSRLDGLFDPKSRYLVTLDNEGQIDRWDLTNGKPLHDRITIQESSLDHRRRIFTISPDARWVFVTDPEGSIFRIDLDASEPMANQAVLPADYSETFVLGVSPNGRFLAVNGRRADHSDSSGEAEKIYVDIWDLAAEPSRRVEEIEFAEKMDGRFSFSQDDRFLAACNPQEIIVFAFSSHKIRRIQVDSPVQHAEFSSNGRYLASSGLSGDIIIWDLSSNGHPKPHQRLNAHFAPSYGLRFFDQDRRLLSVSYDSTTRVWDLDYEVLKTRALEIAGRELTDSELEQYLPWETEGE